MAETAMSVTIERIANGFVVYTPLYTYVPSRAASYNYEGTQTGVDREYFPTLEMAINRVRVYWKAYAAPPAESVP